MCVLVCVYVCVCVCVCMCVCDVCVCVSYKRGYKLVINESPRGDSLCNNDDVT